MRILVTAGGTREPIDDVRVVANSSTGRLGAHVVDAARQAGHEVILLHGQGAVQPRLPGESHEFGPSAQLGALLEQHVPGCDAVVHAAAVSDYVPERIGGKLSSDASELVLRLRRAPKLIDGLRRLAPAAVLVGFKLTSDPSEAERLTLAERLLRRASLDLVVVNDISHVGERDHEAVLLGPEGVVCRARGKAGVAAAIVERLVPSSAREVAAP